MSTTTATRARANGKARNAGKRVINWLHKGAGYGVLKIGEVLPRAGERSDAYYCQPFEADFGIACYLTKLAPQGETYAVNFHPVTGEKSCECLGFLAHGHCKHSDGLEALVNAGRWLD